MAINDTLANLLIKAGLKKSEAQKLEDQIHQLEERIRDLQDDLNGKVEETDRLVAKIRRLKAKCDAAAPASRQLLEDQIRSLMRDFKYLKESQGLTLRNIEKHKLLLQNRRLALEHAKHPVDVQEIEDVTDDKQEMVDELKDEDKELARLDDMTYTKESVQDAEKSDSLDRELEALIGKSEEPQVQNEVSESPVEIA